MLRHLPFQGGALSIPKALLENVVVSSPQCGENTAFFSGFPLGGIHGSGLLPVIPLELEKSISHFL